MLISLNQEKKDFLLAGNSQRGQYVGKNIFSGFNVQLLSEAFGISKQVAQRLQGQNDPRGDIIRVDHGLQFLKPIVAQAIEEQPSHQQSQYPTQSQSQYPTQRQYPSQSQSEYPTQSQYPSQYPTQSQYPSQSQSEYQTQSQYPTQCQYPSQSESEYPTHSQYPSQSRSQYPTQSQYPSQYPTQSQYPSQYPMQSQYPSQSQSQCPLLYPTPYQGVQSMGGTYNGLEENFCALNARMNIENPSHADTYNPRAGTITNLNSQKFPILNLVQMSATRVNLYQNAVLSPFWNINAHSVVYMIQGHARVQVVNNLGRTVFNGVLRQGQLLIIPQNYVVLKKAERQGCQYIAFKTNANSMVSHIAGKNSILRALPVDVIANAYGISRQEARNLKNNRGEELGVFTPKYTQGPSYQGRPNGEESDSTNGEEPASSNKASE